MRSTPRRLLDCLMILALILVWTAWLVPHFIKKIIKPRKHGGDDEKKNLRSSHLSPKMKHVLPQREPPFQASMSGACCPIQHFVEKRKEVTV